MNAEPQTWRNFFFCLYLLFIECFSVFGHIVSALRSQQRLNLYFNSENITFLVNNDNINDNNWTNVAIWELYNDTMILPQVKANHCLCCHRFSSLLFPLNREGTENTEWRPPALICLFIFIYWDVNHWWSPIIRLPLRVLVCVWERTLSPRKTEMNFYCLVFVFSLLLLVSAAMDIYTDIFNMRV